MRYAKKHYPHHPDQHIGNLKRFFIATGIVVVIGLYVVIYLTMRSEDQIQINFGETAIKNNSKP